MVINRSTSKTKLKRITYKPGKKRRKKETQRKKKRNMLRNSELENFTVQA